MAENAFELSEQRHAQIVAHIAEVNGKQLRLESAGMEIDYQDSIDFLRISVGDPREALELPLEDGTSAVFMYDPETYEIVGLEVPSFNEGRAKGLYTGEFWELVAGLIERHGPTIYVPGSREMERAGKAFQDLVNA